MSSNIFMKLGNDIKGESKDEEHKDWIEIESFTWSASSPASFRTHGLGQGTAQLSEVSCSIAFDKSVPKMFEALGKGTHIPTVEVDVIKGGDLKKPYLKLSMTEVYVTSLTTAGAAQGEWNASFTLAYKTYKLEYSTQDDKGNLTKAGQAEFNMETNKITG